jgi:hypothetical protein
MVDVTPRGNRQPYIPPSQRAARVRRSLFMRSLGLLSQLLSVVLVMICTTAKLPFMPLKMLLRWRSNSDPKKLADTAWRDFRSAAAAFQATTASTQRQFGDPEQLKLMLEDLSAAGAPSIETGFHERACSLLQRFLDDRQKLFEQLSAVASTARAANVQSRRLARVYDREANAYDHRSARHASYLQLASDCRKEAEFAKEASKKAVVRQARLRFLMTESNSIVRFFTELQLHHGRFPTSSGVPDTYRLQVAEAVSLCLEAVVALEP